MFCKNAFWTSYFYLIFNHYLCGIFTLYFLIISNEIRILYLFLKQCWKSPHPPRHPPLPCNTEFYYDMKF